MKYLIAAAMCLACVSSFAQDGAMVDAAAPKISQASFDAANELLQAMRFREALTTAMQSTAQAWVEQTRHPMRQGIQNDARLNAKEKQEALAKFEASLARLEKEAELTYADAEVIDDIMAGLVTIYARKFSVDELHQLSMFYHTPIGRKLAASNPQVTAELANVTNLVLLPRVNRFAAKVAQELGAK
jgi:hypothetical protein